MVALALALAAFILGLVELVRTRGQGTLAWAVVLLGLAGAAGWLGWP